MFDALQEEPIVWTPDTRKDYARNHKDYASDMAGAEWEKIKSCLWLLPAAQVVRTRLVFAPWRTRDILSTATGLPVEYATQRLPHGRRFTAISGSGYARPRMRAYS
ncbi:hypothetical protein [Nitrosomonas sp. Nm132]|uniref:hypothetical protein n=1 Tax=Nitrosomonas sp. Nm132 TaxID=1881053 RepID=UPI00088A8FF0|nr:hypothetical protein [Nitrosomonas sp. Nm132]SDI09345.1 hypothetical protein SAMN05428952_10781 [Nitrosomonas sp. Nm132]